MTDTDTRIAFELHALYIAARETEPLTFSQKRAMDYFQCGFNVFPIPTESKVPFENTSLKRLFNSRLHFCGDGVQTCRHGKSVPNFAILFYGQKNIACMTGKTSGNLLAVDCDSQAAYTEMGKQLDARGLAYSAFTSHAGRGCYLLRVIEGETVNRPSDKNGVSFCDAKNITSETKFKDVELWGNSHYVILPLSKHPSGTVYRWRGDGDPETELATTYRTLPAVRVTALEWLGVTLLKDSKKQTQTFETFGLAPEYFVLSERNREMLAHGTHEGERNARLTALAYDLKGNDLRKGEIESDFCHSAEMCDPPYPTRDALAVLKSAYRKERVPAKKRDSLSSWGGHDQTKVKTFAASFDWRASFERKARTRRAVFMACIERAEVEGETFRAAIREIAEAVNRTYQYGNVCLHDLVNAGLLRCVTSWNNSASGANVYVFGETVKHYAENKTVSYPCNSNVSFSAYSKVTNSDEYKDVFGLKGLGAVAGEVLKALQAKKYKSAYAIAKDIHAANSSVQSAVKSLVKHGLAIHSEAEGLYYAEAVNDKQLLTLSVKLKTNGRAELQRIRHGIDREIFINRNLAKAMSKYNDVTGQKR
jgi:predicted transcriptional regulator